MVQVTVITSQRPKRLSKLVRRGADGRLLREGGGILAEGKAEIALVRSLDEFANRLQSLEPDQALTFGIPKCGDGRIMSRSRLKQQLSSDGITTRTRDQFNWPEGPGVLMLDHDPGEEPFTRDDLVSTIRAAAPGLETAAMLWWPSASSHIHDAHSGNDLTGLRGQRLYLLVRDAADIPRAGAALVDRLWAAGHGYIVVSAAGVALVRCPIDGSVWQPERLDFAAGAVCGEGLEQRRGHPELIPGHREPVDTRTALADDPEITAAADVAKRRATADAAPDMRLARDAFLDRMYKAMVPPDAQDDDKICEAARSIVRRAIDRHVLSGDFPVEVEIEPGRFETVTVEQLLQNRETYHDRLTRDPLEPDYDGGRTTGKLFLLGFRPTLFSFARHGRNFRLVAAPVRVEVPRGRMATATDAALAVLQDDPAVFDHGGQVVLVFDQTPVPLDEHALAHHLAGIVQFWQFRKAGEEFVEVDIDPPAKLIRQILSLGPRRKLKRLAAVITAPTIRPDGTVLATPGYDRETGLLVCLADQVDIDPKPSREDMQTALEVLMSPFKTFPLADPLARGGLLAALLTAVIRPALKTSPAFAMDAPVQGSGKTLLASCVAALATGRMPEIWPHTAGRDDEEIRKRLFAALRDGTTALVWDNITGVFDSAALAAAITAPSMRDRVLGRSEVLSIPNRALWLFTGNNLCVAGDLPRRIIPIRIDPRTDTPFVRQFDLDPLQHVLDHRTDLARAAVVLVLGWLGSGAPRAPGRMASFEVWDDLVRQTVNWLERDIAPGQFGDPLELVRQAQGADPEQESLFALLEALRQKFVGCWFTARDVSQQVVRARNDHFADEDTQILAEVIADIGGERALRSTKSIGRILQFREGRIALGFSLRSRAARNGREYKVESTLSAEDCGFGGFSGFESGSCETGSPGHEKKSERAETNPPNPPNPQHRRYGFEENG